MNRWPYVAAITGAVVYLLVLTGCGHVSPSVKQYGATFKVCMMQNGITALEGEGIEAWRILDSGGSVAADIVGKLETLGLTLGGQAGMLVLQCAVQSWLSLHPVNMADRPSRSQVAARIYLMRHIPATTRQVH